MRLRLQTGDRRWGRPGQGSSEPRISGVAAHGMGGIVSKEQGSRAEERKGGFGFVTRGTSYLTQFVRK